MENSAPRNSKLPPITESMINKHPIHENLSRKINLINET